MYLLKAIGRGAIADSAMNELAARSRRWPMTYSARLGRVYFGGRCNRNRPPRGARGQADAFLPRGQKATASPANRDARQDQQGVLHLQLPELPDCFVQYGDALAPKTNV